MGKKFGEEGALTPSEAAKKSNALHPDRYGVRRGIRKYATKLTMEMLEDDGEASLEEYLDMPIKKLNVLDGIAIKHLKQAVAGNVSSMEKVEIAVEGKVADKSITASIDYAKLINGATEDGYDSEFDEDGEGT